MLDLFPVTTRIDEQDHLRIADLDVAALCQRYGTPLYIYDAETVRRQIQALTSLLNELYPAASEITYAAKAYFSLRFAQKLAGYGAGVDVVSLSELEIARRAGFTPTKIHLHGNNKSEEEILTAVRLGVQAVVVDNLDELEMITRIAAQEKTPLKIWLRITPGLDVATHPYRQTGHHASKFGLPVEGKDVLTAIQLAQTAPYIHLTGLHMHLGSQLFENEPFGRAITILYELAEKMGVIPQELSPGGGWGVAYTSTEQEADPRGWVQMVSTTVQRECLKRKWELPKLILEPGRWIVAKAGVAAYSVGTTKTAADGTHFVAVDGGMADNPRPALYQAVYSACIANRMTARPVQQATVVGKFCESGDQLIQQVDLPLVKRGDILVMPVAGAYQLSMSSNYNLAARPTVLWVENGSVEVLQSREMPHLSRWWMGDS